MQQYDNSRSQGLGAATTEPEYETQPVDGSSGETTSMNGAQAPHSAGQQFAPEATADAAETPATEVAEVQAPTPAQQLENQGQPVLGTSSGVQTPQPATPAMSEPQNATASQAAASTPAAPTPSPISAAHLDENDDDEMSMASLLDNPANAMHELQRGEVIEGIVARIDADEVLVDIGQKSEGVISSREMGPLGENGALRLGQQVLVYIMQPESAEGHAVLSLKRARMEQSWRDAEGIMQADRVVEAPVVDFNKGGLIVEVGVRGFVPISQISELRGLAKGADSGDSPQVAERLAAMRGRVLKLKIIELNRARNRLILSERLAMQEERAGRKEALMQELEPGQVRPGRVTSLASFGAFVDLGGADGLVHISQLSYSRVNHPSEVLGVGDEVNVYVLSIDPQTKKIALSLKKAQPDPWTLVEERYKVGDVVEGTITKLAKFGAFARIDDGIEGLIHLTELTDGSVDKPQDVVSEGQQVRLRVIAINSQRRRLGLSLRQAQGDLLLPVEAPVEFDDDVDDDAPARNRATGTARPATTGATTTAGTGAATSVEPMPVEPMPVEPMPIVIVPVQATPVEPMLIAPVQATTTDEPPLEQQTPEAPAATMTDAGTDAGAAAEFAPVGTPDIGSTVSGVPVSDTVSADERENEALEIQDLRVGVEEPPLHQTEPQHERPVETGE